MININNITKKEAEMILNNICSVYHISMNRRYDYGHECSWFTKNGVILMKWTGTHYNENFGDPITTLYEFLERDTVLFTEYTTYDSVEKIIIKKNIVENIIKMFI